MTLSFNRSPFSWARKTRRWAERLGKGAADG